MDFMLFKHPSVQMWRIIHKRHRFLYTLDVFTTYIKFLSSYELQTVYIEPEVDVGFAVSPNELGPYASAETESGPIRNHSWFLEFLHTLFVALFQFSLPFNDNPTINMR